MLTDKTAPIGTCDHCLGHIHPDEHYTIKGKPRRYCCRNTANTLVGCAAAMMRLAVTGMIIAIAIVAMATFK